MYTLIKTPQCDPPLYRTFLPRYVRPVGRRDYRISMLPGQRSNPVSGPAASAEDRLILMLPWVSFTVLREAPHHVHSQKIMQ